ncbi:MAG: 6,7-dimethyl-8-ribityllumazine synthase [bacterium]
MAHDKAAEPHGKEPPPRDQPAITDTTAEFDEYTAPPRLDEHGNPLPKSKGLRAAGYQFPPAGGPQPPLTKANLAKGIGVPEVPRSAPTAKSTWPVPPLPGMPAVAAADPKVVVDKPSPPPSVKVTEDPLFEEYQRPDLKEHPRTGKGIRHEPPPPPKAHEILSKMKEPDIEVATPKRFGVMPVKEAPPPRSPEEKAAQEKVAAHEAAVADQAVLDAAADLASAPELVMSKSSAYGPSKTVVEHPEGEDIFAPIPEIPPAVHGASPLPHPPAASRPAPTISAPAEVPVTATPYVPRPPAAVQVPRAAPAPTHAAPSHAPTTHAAADAQHSTSGTPHTSGAPPIKPGGTSPRIAILQSDYHFDTTTRMAEAAKARAQILGAPIAAHHHVPGVFDVPLAAKLLLRRNDIDALVVVGAVVQGETGHDVIIARETARKLADLAFDVEKPVGLGITGPGMTEAQAQARVNAGAHAVDSVVQQHRLLVGLRA